MGARVSLAWSPVSNSNPRPETAGPQPLSWKRSNNLTSSCQRNKKKAIGLKSSKKLHIPVDPTDDASEAAALLIKMMSSVRKVTTCSQLR